MTLRGAGWSRRDVLKCRVGQYMVDAWHVGDGLVVCAVPPGPMGLAVKVSLVTDPRVRFLMTYTYVMAPSIINVWPARGPTQGRTRVSMTGKFFSSTLLCRFGDAPPYHLPFPMIARRLRRAALTRRRRVKWCWFCCTGRLG